MASELLTHAVGSSTLRGFIENEAPELTGDEADKVILYVANIADEAGSLADILDPN